MIGQFKFQIICQLSVRMLRSKNDLSAKISKHVSFVRKDVEIKTFVSLNVKPSVSCQYEC